jgi:threonine dehydratase
VGIGTSSKDDAAKLSSSLNELGYKTVDLSESEVAKLHVRHMVGGHAVDTEHELLCRFEFPERPGALMHFLDALGDRWNISLFHYRNHGADFGRVLAGFEIPERDRDQFTEFLEQLGYPYQLELESSAYDLFLS